MTGLQKSFGSVQAVRGIDLAADLPVAVDSVDPTAREVLGYVAREAVTNVVRHSAATCCTITVGTHWIEVVDDGRPPTGGEAKIGSGLPGLRQRVQQAGGVVDAGPLAGGGFRVWAYLPAGTPISSVAPRPASPIVRAGTGS